MSSYPTRRRQRLAGFDYTTAGYYAVTLCVQDRLVLFGHLGAGQVYHSPAGAAIEQILYELPIRYPGTGIDVAMIMPDHLHVILTLDGTTPALSRLVHWFKAQTTARYARGVQEEGWLRFAGTLWQRGFHDRIIRNEAELDAIRAYIMTNPARWMLRQQGIS